VTNPTTSWDLVPIWGIYLKGDGVTPIRGTLRLSFTQRVTRVDGRAIYPEGHVVERTIGDTSTDPATRDRVRAAWRAADQVRAGDAFDGPAWDARWNQLMAGAVFAAFPASDDPDIVQTGYQVKVEEKLEGGTGKVYYLTPLLSQLDALPPGINLGQVEVPPGAPSAPAPMYAKSVPGGVAALDADGDVVDARGEKLAAPGQVSVNGQEGPLIYLTPEDVGAQPAGEYATAQALADSVGDKVGTLVFAQGIVEAQDRSNHTGTQDVDTIDGLASVAVSGSFGDLIDAPAIPTAAELAESEELQATYLPRDEYVTAEPDLDVLDQRYVQETDAVELATSTGSTLTGTPTSTGLAADAGHTHRLPNIDANGCITLTTADGTPVKLLVVAGVVGAGGGAAGTAPGQVTGLTPGTPTSTTQPLTWTAPSAGSSPITDYLVQYRLAGATSWSTFADGTSTTTSATVTGLTAGTTYEFHTAAVSAVGTGPFSATITATTAGTASAPAGTGFTDSFTRSDGAVGNGWSAIGSTNAVVASNKLMKTNNNYSAGGVRRDLALASGTLTVTVSNPGDAGIIFRWLSDSDFYAYYDHEIWHHAAGGARTKAVDSVGRVDSAAGATLSVVMDGTNVTAYTDGTLTHNFTETTNAASTSHGIFLNTTAVTADDFSLVPR
jgi:hypothetical protein